MSRTRGELLTDLADAINELTEPHTITEYREVTITEAQATANGRRKRARRTRRREAHHVTLPGLIDALRNAAVPGSGDGTPGTAGGFESRPSAELEPLSVLREITDDLGWYTRRYDLERPTVNGLLHALVSLNVPDTELGRITRQAQRWVRRARYATGLDPAPVTLNQPCPYCRAPNAIVLTGDLNAARCNRCGVDWTPDTIGLLADMLRTNETQTTAAAVRCWMADCTRRGPHDDHTDDRGRVWNRDARCVTEDGLPATRRPLEACG